MELLEALTQTFDHTAKIVDGVQPSQLDGPTPCRDWDLRALLGHMTGVVVNMGRGANGEDLLPDPSAFQLDADPAAQFRTEADRALAAWTAHGSDGEVNIGAGPMPVPVAMSINILDTSTHSWDIARATGQDGNLPDDLAATALTLCQGIVTDDVRGFAGFDPIVPVGPDASATDQLVAFLGRTP